MADCAAVGCFEPALEVWRPKENGAPRFHYLVCQLHALALRSDVRHTPEGHELRIESLPQLRDWKVTQSGGQAVLHVAYDDGLESANVSIQADTATLKQLGESMAAMQVQPAEGVTRQDNLRYPW